MKKQPGNDFLLEPFRALDLTDEKGFLCGRMLADLGVDVIKIEKPGGDPARNIGPFYHDEPHHERSLYWFAFNANKRGITLDLETVAGRDTFTRLVMASDFVIESFPPGYLDNLGLGYQALSRINPRIILTSITGFGQSGPHKDFKASDLVVMAMGGLMYVTGEPDRPPLRFGFPNSCATAGAQAALGTLIAHYYREVSGEGQHVDVSAQESIVPSLIGAKLWWEFAGDNVKRGAPYRRLGAKARQQLAWPCLDGYVSFSLWGGMTGAQSNRELVRWMDSEGMAPEFMKSIEWEAFDISAVSQEEFERIDREIGRFFEKHTKVELFQGALEKRVLLYPIQTIGEVAEDAQLKARNFMEPVNHPELGTAITYPGTFARFSATRCGIRRRAPLIGEHNEEVYRLAQTQQTVTAPGNRSDIKSRQAFDGIKVVDFGWAIVEPWTMKYLADHGAEVIRIESATRVGGTRTVGPYKDGISNPDRAAYHTVYNGSKYGITLNLKHPGGVEIAKRLVARADIAGEGYAPGVMRSLGLDYAELKKIKPDIIMISTCNMGQSGPYSSHPGYGSQLAGYTGFATTTGWSDGWPVLSESPYNDFVAPLFGASAIIAALDYRRRTGKGQHIDLSQYEAGIQFLAPLILDFTVNRREASRMGNRCACAAPHGAYPCQGDDRWCVIAVFDDAEWVALCRAMGNPPWTGEAKFATLAGRKQNEDELDKLIGQWTSQFASGQVMAMLQASGIRAGVVQTSEDIYNDPQLKHRNHFQTLRHREIGEHYYEMPAFRLSRSPAQLKPAACLGEHNHYVYTRILGLTDEQFVELMGQGVFT